MSRKKLKKFIFGNGRHELMLIGILIAELIIFSILSPKFLTASNMFTSIRSFVELGIMALGMTFLIMSGGIDLSVGSMLALVSVTIGFIYQAGLPLGAAILAGLLAGMLCGALNGFLTVYGDIHPFVVTLGTMSLFRGLAYATTGGNAVSKYPDWFAIFGGKYLGVIPIQVIYFIIIVFVMFILLKKTRLGSYVAAIGYNEQATYFSGVPARRIRFALYILSGVLVAIASTIYTSRVWTARGNSGMGIEMLTIAAVVLGGTDINGGKGSILGTMLGVFIVAFLENGVVLAGIPSAWGSMIEGGLLAFGVVINMKFHADFQINIKMEKSKSNG